ncbi:hypothetical protein [Novosphingobium sp.]|uniref:hypothetical protein n=1 Tax=Novosphingobium sp. TaxID=1874826 RepID=UPI0025D75734|nr:hypothetical protein [Novosphingobium sp.]
MNFGHLRRVRVSAAIALAASGTALCAATAAADPVSGVWLVEHPTAPFPLHLYVFNADHTMQQANPDAGNPRESDSDGKGIWLRKGNRIVGKWVEIMADRTTHKLTGRGELTFELTVSGNRITGTGSFTQFDAAGLRKGDLIDAPFTGSRITVP